MKIPILKGLERPEEEKREALAKNHPLLLSLYLDALCNLRCKFCFLDSGKSNKMQQLSLEEYKDLIRQGKYMGVKSVLRALIIPMYAKPIGSQEGFGEV